MSRVSSFTFNKYKLNTRRSIITFTYRVEFESGRTRTYTDKLYFPNVTQGLWDQVPALVLEPTLQSLLLMIGINYWCIFRTKNIHVEGFTLTRDQAQFWDKLYLNGLGEYFYKMHIDFRNLIAFPYDASASTHPAVGFERPHRALVLNGAGKDSILSAEMMKSTGTPFDLFSFDPSPAHNRIAKLVSANHIKVYRKRDWRIKARIDYLGYSDAYPSVSTFTFIATLLAETMGYNSIIFSNERSADVGNTTYLGLAINHQWCKSSEPALQLFVEHFGSPKTES